MKKLLLLTFLSPLVCFGATTFPSGGGGTVSSNSIRSLGFLQTNGVGTGLTGLPGGGDALVANPLSQFAATTSAQFFGVISDEDGNGPVLAAKDNTQTNVTIMDGLIVTNKATGQFMQISNGVATLGGGSGPGLAIFLEGAAPSNPSSGSQALYVDSTSHQVSAKPSGGMVSVMVTPDTGAAHNFFTAISAAGVPSKAQPAFTDISGTVAAGQMPDGSGVTNWFVSAINPPIGAWMTNGEAAPYSAAAMNTLNAYSDYATFQTNVTNGIHLKWWPPPNCVVSNGFKISVEGFCTGTNSAVCACTNAASGAMTNGAVIGVAMCSITNGTIVTNLTYGTSVYQTNHCSTNAYVKLFSTSGTVTPSGTNLDPTNAIMLHLWMVGSNVFNGSFGTTLTNGGFSVSDVKIEYNYTPTNNTFAASTQ